MAKPRRSIKRRLTSKFQQKRIPQFGLLGDYSHTVEVPGRPNYVYVRFAGQDVVSEVFNDRVAPLEDLEVLVGYDPEEPNVYQVLDIRSNLRRYAEEDETIAYLPEHHRTHEWMNMPGGGNDVVFVELRQFMPLRVTPTTTGVALSINRGIIYGEDRWIYVTGQTVNFGSYLPGTGSRYALLSVGLDDGLPDIQIGTLKDTATLLFDDIPDPIPGTYPLAAVRLYGEQTRIYEAYSNTDIADLRFPGSHSFLGLSDTPISYTGSASKALFVTGAEDGLEFLNITLSNDLTGTIDNAIVQGILDKPIFIPDGHPIAGDVIQYNSGQNRWELVSGSAAVGGGASTFLELTDTPSSYSGFADRSVKVNSAGSGLEFTTTGSFVAVRYEHSALQNIPPTTGTVINYDSKVIDTHNAVTLGSNWKFTPPRDGYYLINAKLAFNLGQWNIGENVNVYVQITGTSSVGADLDYRYGWGTNNIIMSLNGSTILKLEENQWIQILCYQATSGNRSIRTGTFAGKYSSFYSYVDIVELNHP